MTCCMDIKLQSLILWQHLQLAQVQIHLCGRRWCQMDEKCHSSGSTIRMNCLIYPLEWTLQPFDFLSGDLAVGSHSQIGLAVLPEFDHPHPLDPIIYYSLYRTQPSVGRFHGASECPSFLVVCFIVRTLFLPHRSAQSWETTSVSVNDLLSVQCMCV